MRSWINRNLARLFSSAKVCAAGTLSVFFFLSTVMNLTLGLLASSKAVEL